MRSSQSRAIPVRSREQRIKDAGLSGARALTRLLVALIENLGYQDKLGPHLGPRREPQGAQPGWPHGTTRTAFGPTPLGAEIERLMRASAPKPAASTVTREPTMTPISPPPRVASPAPATDMLRTAPPGTVGFARGQVRPPAPKMPPPEAAPAAPPTAAAPALETPSAEPTPKAVEPEIPAWQRPFVAAPGVRYMRTPDHVLRRVKEVDAPIIPIAPPTDEEPSDSSWYETVADDDDRFETDDFQTDGFQTDDLQTDDLQTDDTQSDDICEVALHIENEAVSGSRQGLPRRLKMTSGFAVDLPRPANDPMLIPATASPLSFFAQKPSFNVTVRPKMLRTPQTPVPAAEIAPPAPPSRVALAAPAPAKARRKAAPSIEWAFPTPELLGEMVKPEGNALTADMLEQNARLLESTLEDFGIRGEIIHVRAGPVVTLYELEPAPGTKSSRVIGLADDIARSMSAVSARVAVVPGRNAIGIELPNERRETVYFREMIESEAFTGSQSRLAIALGKTIGGEPVIAELAKMPHLLVAGTTGSGKSVAINTMILSLLYRLKPEQCRLIMVDPKMLELSIYDGIPHLLTPVVTDPKKAVVALKWAVREMEDRYRKMSKVGVRNIDGFNRRVAEARHIGEQIMVPVTTGFDRETGKPTIEDQPLDLTALPYIVVIVDEMADLMMVAGKEIEGAIQRLAQMARAAGIHLIMATQRPSVDVITGTIKANFPTRISFQVTSKIDSRTILGEMGAEQLLGQGDMLHMQGGGRIYRVHGPFVSDEDVERVVAHLKAQRAPEYIDSVTDDVDEVSEDEADADGDDGAVFDKTAMGEEDGDLYDQAVKIVLRDKKSSISYVQRRLQVGYNKAASLIERMEKDGILSPASHTGKREILAPSRTRVITGVPMGDEEG